MTWGELEEKHIGREATVEWLDPKKKVTGIIRRETEHHEFYLDAGSEWHLFADWFVVELN